MDFLYREWGGVEQKFCLDLGLVMDLEQACGNSGIGAIYLRLASHQHFARDVYQVLRMGLIGGGMPRDEVDRLLKLRFSEVPLADSLAIAVDIVAALNEGVDEKRASGGGDGAVPMDLGKIFAGFVQVGIGPDQVRQMRYADFVNLTRAIGGDVAPPSEEEFDDMIRRHGEVHGV